MPAQKARRSLISHWTMTCNCSLRSRIVNFNGSHGRSAPLERFGPKWRIRALEQDGSRGSSLLVRHLSWIVPLLLLGTVWAQEPSQPQIAQAQERLRSLGFEVGDTAGVLDPRTAKALEAFQRTAPARRHRRTGHGNLACSRGRPRDGGNPGKLDIPGRGALVALEAGAGIPALLRLPTCPPAPARHPGLSRGPDCHRLGRRR